MEGVYQSAVPRKRIATYGKAGRRRIPGFAGTSLESTSHGRELKRRHTPDSPASETLGSSSTGQVSESRSAEDEVGPPSTKADAPRLVKKPIAIRRPDIEKANALSHKPAARTTSSTDSIPDPGQTQSRNNISPIENELPIPSRNKTVVRQVVTTRSKPIPRKMTAKASSAISVSTNNLRGSRDVMENVAMEKNSGKSVQEVVSRSTNSEVSKLSQKVPAIRATPPPISHGDVFDMPESDDEAPKIVARTKPSANGRWERSKPLPKKQVLKIPPPNSRSEDDIFDVPLSGDEAPKRAPSFTKKIRPKAVLNSQSKITGITRRSPTASEDTESRKRIKLSPISKLANKKASAAALSKPSPAKQRALLPQNDGRLINVAARPKLLAPSFQSEPSITPRRAETVIRNEYETPSPPLIDIDMIDVDSVGPYFSPNGIKMWKGLLDSAVKNGKSDGSMDKRATNIKIPRDTIISASSQPNSSGQSPRNFGQGAPRRRLIDTLVEQATARGGDQDGDSEDSEDSLSNSFSVSEASPEPMASFSRQQSIVPEPQLIPPPLADSQTSQTMGPKVTYSRQRSMLAEADLLAELALDMPIQSTQAPRRRRVGHGSVPKLQPLVSFNEEVEDDEHNGAAVRSVHELRQAGAVNRFLDEVQDFLDRIGDPSAPLSMRRSGLLDLSSKIREKNFARQFRANGVEQQIFVHLGLEKDIVNGFLLVTLLVSVLTDHSMPHIVAHLRRQGITRLLIRQLDNQLSIHAICKDRKTNMSKVAQNLLAEYHESILQLPIWDDLQPLVLSPRTAALKCLELMVRQTREAGSSGDMFSKELTTKLFSLVNSASDERSWKLPKEKQAIDFYLALSALESHSIVARTVHDESIWISDYLPIVANTLEIALSKPMEDFGVLQLLLLRLTLNVTNNNPIASEVFARGSLMAAMGHVVVARFKQISNFMTEDDFTVAVDHLVLVLGVMINFAEWSSTARECFQALERQENDPLNGMLRAFMDNQAGTSIAESLEESQKNVAFGYLSVLLGYLSLLPGISRRIRIKQPQQTLGPLLASIEEFIGHHRTVDKLAAEGVTHNPQSGLTERLESLVNKLNAL